MAEETATGKRDLRAGAFVASLRRAKGLSPEQMAEQCGVGGNTIRDLEKKGTYPWPATRTRIALFFGLTEDQIWTEPRMPIRKKRSVSEKAVAAVSAAMDDLTVLEAVVGGDEKDALALGVAWAVIRAQSPFSSSEDVTERAVRAVEAWHGDRSSAPAGA